MPRQEFLSGTLRPADDLAFANKSLRRPETGLDSLELR